ncbi:hypothetical protein MKW98_010482 [Papaver atlanticum]|uniref:Uncharacterized protein n=1 Tax=Papaver atlanticum TaxID=357466 RepID=A0AAD4TB36_9MAGN|nr:hypothetical protein MKW98_010482 [Papaver atlanticum]
MGVIGVRMKIKGEEFYWFLIDVAAKDFNVDLSKIHSTVCLKTEHRSFFFSFAPPSFQGGGDIQGGVVTEEA